MRLPQPLLLAFGVVASFGCQTSTSNGHQDDGGLASSSSATGRGSISVTSSAGSSGSSSGAASSSVSASGSSTAGSSSGGSSGGSASSSGGSSTGIPLPPIIDGGYVFCEAAGGFPNWACMPGTYFCNLDGGDCVQCRSDADCTNEALPTYDPGRPHCDVGSGIRGYQNHCVHCVADVDCADNPAGPYCELQFYGGGLTAVLNGGFESCQGVELDCRVDGGPLCHALNTFCNAGTGICDNVYGYCKSNADCAGIVEPFQSGPATVPLPYCDQGYCAMCLPDAGYCPQNCSSDLQCPSGMTCVGEACSCSSDDQCGGLWPVCVDGGYVGSSPGLFCGCTSNDQCGDGGLVCLTASPGGVCGVSCTAPDFPLCSSIERNPVCDPSTGVCTSCSSDAQCQTLSGGEGPHCLSSQQCGCELDSECPAGEVCENGACALAAPPCTRDCFSTPGACSSDYDCALGATGTCCQDEGFCGACPQPGFCESNLDCLSSPVGMKCGPRGNFGLPNLCYCETGADCDGGTDTCRNGVCEPRCSPSINCPAGLSCDADYDCRARCDHGGTCPADAPLCDTANHVGMNGESGHGALPGAVWCYECASESDCPWPTACLTTAGYTCGACSQPSDCASGETCIGGQCLAICVSDPCPTGQVCDSNNSVGFGTSVCLQCLGPWDCSGHEGCNYGTCGSCSGPNANEAVGLYIDDCPPGDICSNYWTGDSAAGVCLQNCDVRPCPDDTTCGVFTDLTPDHKYCFECRSDADCADAGPGAWCNLSPFPTFTCKTGPRP